MSTKSIARRVRAVYEFIKTHRDKYDVRTMCRVLGVAPSGYYKWLQHPVSNRGQEDARLLRLIRASFVASHGIYGAPRVFLDLREAGETCSKHRVARLMREANLRALHGYRMGQRDRAILLLLARLTVAPIYEIESRLRRLTEETYRARGGKGEGLPGMGGGRVDFRFAVDNDGELYILTKSDGMIRKVVGAWGAAAPVQGLQP
jgi:hypothetical protein